MPAGDHFRVTVWSLNVRQAPSITAAVIGYLHKDEIITCLDISGNGYWYKIELGALKGWAAHCYLEPVLDPPVVEAYPWMSIALAEIGIKEFPGDGDNPRILEYLKSTNLEPPWSCNDETAWCSAFVNWCIERAGYEGTDSAWARSWLTWGRLIDSPERGSIAIFSRDDDGSSGHVGFYAGESLGSISILGGNQCDQVRLTNYDPARLLGYRLPG